MTKRTSIANKLRTAIRKAERRGITRYRIATDAGIPLATLNRFYVEPDRTIRLDTAEKLAKALGLKLELTE